MKVLTAFVAMTLVFFVGSGEKQRPVDRVSTWLNVDYIKCLNNDLPCQCEKKVGKYITVNIDTSSGAEKGEIALEMHAQIEPFYYPLKKVNKSRYDILLTTESLKRMGSVRFGKDTLYLNQKGIVSKFVKIGNHKYLDNDNAGLKRVELISKALNKRGYPGLNELLSKDLIQCDCNKWIDRGVNFVSIKGKPQAWVLEQLKDSLIVYKVMNGEDADPDDPLIKKAIYKYRWALK